MKKVITVLLVCFCLKGFAQCWQSAVGGEGQTIAIKTDGTLWAWGLNNYGQLGDGTNISSLSPIQIGTDNTWKTIAVGFQHCTAIKLNGSLWAWGRNNSGQL
jgi:alpha-tubulin suppressor-like RCC1 family protein